MNWFKGDADAKRFLVKTYSEDRDMLLDSLDELYPDLDAARPSEKVELVITELCRFHVVDEPLPLGQLAVCDFNNRLVVLNSLMAKFVHHKANRELLRRSTLAHELGHIRLHADEILEGCTIQYHGTAGQFSDARAFQKEKEADLYAGIFLVPLEKLLKERAIQNLLRNLKNKKQMGVGTLWKLIYAQASRFRVSPSLMKRCLVELGWIQQGNLRKSGLREIRLRFR